MDLSSRKYHFIQELIKIDKESVLETLELVLKREKEAEGELSAAHKKELDERMKNYQNNPNDLLEWEQVKKAW